MSMDFPGFFSSLIIKINYPHMSGGLKGPLSPPQELEVGGPLPLAPAEGLGGPSGPPPSGGNLF